MAQPRKPETTDTHDLPASRLERTLAFMVFSTIGLSILCFLAVIIGSTLGWAPWPVIIFLPLVGLPIGFALIITLIVFNLVRRSRANRAAQ
jgi:membrane protein DedA with SNARE-associated domain